jgi:hypothetical protein
MLASDLARRPVATQPSQHDLKFCCAVQLRYLHCSLNLISLSVERPMLSPVAGRPLRRYAPPGSSGAPSQLPVNAGPGSGARASGFGLGREEIEEWSDLVIGLSGMPHCRFSVD